MGFLQSSPAFIAIGPHNVAVVGQRDPVDVGVFRDVARAVGDAFIEHELNGVEGADVCEHSLLPFNTKLKIASVAGEAFALSSSVSTVFWPRCCGEHCGRGTSDCDATKRITAHTAPTLCIPSFIQRGEMADPQNGGFRRLMPAKRRKRKAEVVEDLPNPGKRQRCRLNQQLLWQVASCLQLCLTLKQTSVQAPFVFDPPLRSECPVATVVLEFAVTIDVIEALRIWSYRELQRVTRGKWATQCLRKRGRAYSRHGHQSSSQQKPTVHCLNQDTFFPI